MNAAVNSVPVLTYHSISSEPGPTSIPPETFRMQIAILAECGFVSMTCKDFLDWRRGRNASAAPRVLITFDDGFADFATAAHPVLAERGFSSLVFVPTGKLGGREDWQGANVSPRALMNWSTIGELAKAGVEFGGHGVNHADLTRLGPERRHFEIERCAQDLAERIGSGVRSFAAPYGHVNVDVLADVARTFEVAFGTRLARARPVSDLFDVPRIEMHYFRNPRRWRSFLQGGGAFFLARRALRAVRTAAERLGRRGAPSAGGGTRG